MSFLIFLAIGLGTIWFGLKVKEEVAQIAAAITGAIFLLWGLTLTPQPFLVSAEVIAVLAVFRLCLRCCDCD
ncbi:hypothetical protein IQ238_03780 [Pleurocapsales cyanobacterium LEGE 06147]|nr:hypothetical protein [Pleurocapsales cyanobacterium LEGE 06147]